MLKSFLGFFKKAIFGAEESKPEPAKETAPPAEKPQEQKPLPYFPDEISVLAVPAKHQKTPRQTPGKFRAKKTVSKKIAFKARPKPKKPVKKTVKIIHAKKEPKKKLPPKTSNPAAKKNRVRTQAKKTAPKIKTKTAKAFVKQAWPKPKDSHIRHEKVKALEQKVSELAREHDVSPGAVEQATQMETQEVIKQQSSLPNISETEEKVESAKKAGKGMEHHEILGLIEEIQKHRIITDFDRIYDEVTEKKRVSAAKLAQDLEIPKTRVEDCAKILEEDKLIEVDYPPVGDEFLQVTKYSEEVREKKEKQNSFILNAKKQAMKKNDAKKGGLNG